MAAFWDAVEINEGDCRLWQAGPLRLWVRQVGEEWHVATESANEKEKFPDIISGETTAVPEDAQWQRWMGRGVEHVVQLSPLMPDRAVVVRPEMPLHMAYGQKEMFFVNIPLWIRVVAGKGKKITICEQASQTLSNTWFGLPVQGELCYALNTKARTGIEEIAPNPLTAVCPLVISNLYKEPLNFERLCIRTDHLSIYETENGLITNEVRVIYQGEEQMSRIKYGKKPPALAEGSKRVADPRKPIENNLIRKSFNNFMQSFEA